MESQNTKEQSSTKSRLLHFIKENHLTQRKFEEMTGLSNGYINSMRKSIKPETFDNKIAPIFPELNKLWILHGEGDMYIPSSKSSNIQVKKNKDINVVRDYLKPKEYSNTLEVKVVMTKARAGFTDSYYSEEYLNDMPTVLIEAEKDYKGNYLAFEVDGDSMEPEYNKGDIVICREVQRSLWQYKLHFKEYDFVIAHGTKGITLKEILDHNTETGDITCHSLNQEDGNHPDFVWNLKEVAFLYNVVEHRISGKSKRRNR